MRLATETSDMKGGLISSTVLTLLLVPTLYMVFEGRKPKKIVGNRN